MFELAPPLRERRGTLFEVFLKKAEEFVSRLGIKTRNDGNNERSMAFPNRSRIVGLPQNEAKVRGFSKVSLLLIDEASRVDDELYRAMRPTLAVGNGDLWLISTPNGKIGSFHEEWTQGGDTDRSGVSGGGEGGFKRRVVSAGISLRVCGKRGAVFSQESIEAALQDFPTLKLENCFGC